MKLCTHVGAKFQICVLCFQDDPSYRQGVAEVNVDSTLFLFFAYIKVVGALKCDCTLGGQNQKIYNFAFESVSKKLPESGEPAYLETCT